jgi:AraC family transcriptional regulator
MISASRLATWVTVAEPLAGSAFVPGRQLSLPALIEGRLGRLVVSVHAFEETPAVPRKRTTRLLNTRELERARSAIKEQYAESIRLPEIAATVGMSPGQFSRSFHATAGVTFTAYVLCVRIDAATRLMLETAKSLCAVAIECGFVDQSHFSRVFARTMGISPLKWRQLQLR